ncbi:MAG: hypothetical protein AAB093_06615 [Nitrospirota bacterium]
MAPNTSLRKWFGRDRAKWETRREHYRHGLSRPTTTPSSSRRCWTNWPDRTVVLTPRST